ncbi:MAG: FtsX-like permease family protein, partial [Chitinophagaceae bacterium]|nr:FtsX-like permease family protein [Chitinophagaceae bacterium]
HVDAPTGNISKAEADKLARNPMVEKTIQLSFGDSYKGYRIVGTTPAYLDMYNASLAKGGLFSKSMEVVVGAAVAKRTGLKVGDAFFSTHGEDERGHTHEESQFLVTGVLQTTGSVIDQLIITNLESVWDIHGEMHEDNPEVAHEEHDGDEKHHTENEVGEETEDRGLQITAMLVKFRSPMAVMMLPRTINEQTSMQAAVPTLEINRLMNLMGIGIATLQGVALAIMLIAGLSVFVSLFNRLKERQFEHALMRTMGTSRRLIFLILVAEGLLLSIAGFVFGILLSRIGLILLNKVAAADFRFSFGYGWVLEEWWLLIITILIGIFAAAIPAFKAAKLNIAQTLSDG